MTRKDSCYKMPNAVIILSDLKLIVCQTVFSLLSFFPFVSPILLLTWSRSCHPHPRLDGGDVVFFFETTTTQQQAGNVTGKDGNHVASQCSDSSPCPANEECVTSEDHANLCVCRRGFIRDKDGEACRDTNECTELSASPCGMNAFCTNLNGGFVCDCPSGYTGNPYTVCYPDGEYRRCFSVQQQQKGENYFMLNKRKLSHKWRDDGVTC